MVSRKLSRLKNEKRRQCSTFHGVIYLDQNNTLTSGFLLPRPPGNALAWVLSKYFNFLMGSSARLPREHYLSFPSSSFFFGVGGLLIGVQFLRYSSSKLTCWRLRPSLPPPPSSLSTIYFRAWVLSTIILQFCDKRGTKLLIAYSHLYPSNTTPPPPRLFFWRRC